MPTCADKTLWVCQFNIVSPGADPETFFSYTKGDRRLKDLHKGIEEMLFGGPSKEAVGELKVCMGRLLFLVIASCNFEVLHVAFDRSLTEQLSGVRFMRFAVENAAEADSSHVHGFAFIQTCWDPQKCQSCHMSPNFHFS